ncbi:sugar transferase [Microvirga sp. GCM10011540]|uniref:sugar transferase n=1 Tax=Microvirga sp. GCM10011540 TaxID=3317338 RepID=UPI00360C0E06
MFIGPAIAALIGLLCSIQSALFLGFILGLGPSDSRIVLTIVTVTALNTSAVVTIAAFAQRGSTSRLLLAFIFSFIAHFTWFAFAAGLKQDIAWSFVPATYIAAVACSIAVDPLRRIARPRKIGAVAAGLSPEILRRLDEGVEIISDPAAAVSRYDVILVDFGVALPPEWTRYISLAAMSNCELRHVRNYVIDRSAYLLPEDVEPDVLRHHLQRSASYAPLKRCIDIGASLLMAPIAFMLGGAAALAIAITMGRPIIFAQDRVGRNGRVFRMYKLRTMSVHSTGGKQIATSKSDCRVTPLGKVLRRYRIDELPQLFNIMKGDMSLIGPRPEQPQLVSEYQQIIPHYDLRHAVQPGLSGWAQVSYGYASTVEETRAKLTYDLFYVREYGLSLDVEIAVATIWTLLAGRNVR